MPSEIKFFEGISNKVVVVYIKKERVCSGNYSYGRFVYYQLVIVTLYVLKLILQRFSSL